MQPSLFFRRNRLRLLVSVFLGVLILMGAGDNSARVDRLGHEMMCMCGCNQILAECNHVGCPYSGPMMKDLAAMVDSGKGDKEILASFVAKYGTTVLAAPTKTGFDRVAWIMPYLALIVGILGVALVVRAWRGRMTAAKVPTDMSDADLARFREQARKETDL
jgi:cytochrome c-type biogenesis protein CcmH